MMMLWKLTTFSLALSIICLNTTKGQTTINIAPTATLKYSSTLSYQNYNYDVHNAVDGLFAGDADECGCCFHSSREKYPYFQASFSEARSVLAIVLEGRKDCRTKLESNLMDITVNLDGQSAFVTFNETTNSATVIPSMPVKTIRVERPYTSNGAGWFLMICELSVYEACPHGHFGKDCARRCHCYNSGDCNDFTGECENDQCASGWTTGSCSEACDNNTYGFDCNETCGNCLCNMQCNVTTGHCPGQCAHGWTGEFCKEKCSEYTYGENCIRRCGFCKDGYPCNVTTGICNNGCEPEYEGKTCKTLMRNDRKAIPTGPVVGGLVALSVCLLLANVLSVMYLRHRLINCKTELEAAKMYSQLNHISSTTETTTYDTIQSTELQGSESDTQQYINVENM